MSLDFTAIDFETTGCGGANILSAGAVKICDGERVDGFFSYVATPIRPEEWNEIGMGKNHIKPADLEGAPEWPIVMERLFKFAGDDVLVFHSAQSADISYIEANCQHFKINKPGFNYICTYKTAEKLHPELKGTKEHPYNLEVLCKTFGIPISDTEYHHADYDAQKCAELLLLFAHDLKAGSLESMSVNYSRHKTLADESIQTEIRSVIASHPNDTAEEWLDQLFPEPAVPGDSCFICQKEISSKARKNYRKIHCCKAPCARKLQSRLNDLHSSMSSTGWFVEKSEQKYIQRDGTLSWRPVFNTAEEEIAWLEECFG